MKNIYLYLNSRDELLRIEFSKIVYFEADGNYTRIIMNNQLKAVVCMNLLKVQRLLNDTLKERANIFARVGKKHIINYTYVYQINVLTQRLVLSDCDKFAYQLTVSKEALKNLKKLFVKSFANNK